MATLTIRRLDESDREWLREAARREGISMEEYVRRLVRVAREDSSRTLGDVLGEMNDSLDPDDRKLLADPPSIERPSPCPRDLFADDDEEGPARAAS